MTDGCVQFSKNSWHYRIAHFVFPSLFWSSGINLCPYMRAVIASIIGIAFVYAWRKLPDRIQEYAWIAQGEVIFLTLVIITVGIMDLVDTFRGNDRLPAFLDMVAYGFLGGNAVGLAIVGCVAGAFVLKDYIEGRPKKDHRTRGLIKTYVKSKHDKICPCVEFEDNETGRKS